MSENDLIKRYGPVVQRVNSRSKPDKEYNIRCRDGVYSCNCPGFPFNKETPKTCKHIRFYLDTLKTEQAKAGTVHREAVLQMLREAGVLGTLREHYKDDANRRIELMAGVLAASVRGTVVVAAASSVEGAPVRLITFDD